MKKANTAQEIAEAWQYQRSDAGIIAAAYLELTEHIETERKSPRLVSVRRLRSLQRKENEAMSYGFGYINDLAVRIAAISKAKGFHEYTPTFGKGGKDVRHILSWLMLVTTEVAEAAEAARKGDKKNFAEELADICIRVFDCAETMGINIEQEIINKVNKNAEREYMHGGKLA